MTTTKRTAGKRQAKPAIDAAAVVEVLKRRQAAAPGGTMKALAAQLGISDVYLRQVMLGVLPPGPKILAALGLVRRVTFAAAGAAETTAEGEANTKGDSDGDN